MGEHICDWAFEDSPTRYVIVRPTNIYGPRDYFDETAHVIPALIRKFSSGKDAVEVFGGNQKREFIYVEDVARGMLAAAEHGQRGEAYTLWRVPRPAIARAARTPARPMPWVGTTS
jgi:nucleoside-diphosphate-sugar epimerase